MLLMGLFEAEKRRIPHAFSSHFPILRIVFLDFHRTSPSEYAGRISHSGIGEYADVIVDGGTMTINPRILVS